MEIYLEDISINAPTTPTREWLNNYDWEEYKVLGVLNDVQIGHITICRALKPIGRYNDLFWFDMSKKPPMPKPVICYQKTEEVFWGKGVCGRLIILANEFYRGKLGTTLYSDTLFIQSFREQSKRVWKKLQEQGLAMFEPYILQDGEKQDRWFML